jgi:putative N-acetylmannosamine-6-phosphate epimerase
MLCLTNAESPKNVFNIPILGIIRSGSSAKPFPVSPKREEAECEIVTLKRHTLTLSSRERECVDWRNLIPSRRNEFSNHPRQLVISVR